MAVTMIKAKKLLKRITTERVLPIPFSILIAVACLVISSYILSSWLMRPIGDDYNSILAYHIDASWWRILPDTVISSGGRYGQTLVSVIWYGILGQAGLRLTGLVSVGLFITAAYLAILAWQKGKKQLLSHKYALAGAALFFTFYTTISITFPWIRGHVDNTFQDFLWLPGFITYTLPLELLAILVATVVLLPEVTKLKVKWLVIVGLLAVFTGTFSEIVPAAYTEFIAIIAIYHLIKHRFKIKQLIRQRIRSYLPFLTIEAGLLIGLVLNFLSPATSKRRAIFEQATTSEIIKQAFKSSRDYLSTYMFGGSATDHNGIWFTIISSVALGLFAITVLKLRKNWQLVKQTALLAGFFGVMALSALFISFAIVFKGYGISPYTYLAPRFEIIYNIWFSLFFIAIGMLIAALLAVIATQRRNTYVIPVAYVLVSLCLLFSLPRVVQQISTRFQTVAVFSANWQNQDIQLREGAANHVQAVTVPVVDIGDSYNIRCDSADNWLGLVKEDYYDIPKICGVAE